MSAVLIIGNTGSGKSASIINLNEKETVLIQVTNKDLPFRTGRKKYNVENKNKILTDDADKIIRAIKKINEEHLDIKTIILDDFQYIMSNEFMRTAKDKGYEKFTNLAEKVWRLINFCITVRDDLDIFILTHSDENEFGKVKIKTIGKLLDEKIVLEGLFTIVLRTDLIDGKYGFRTKTNGADTTKAPMGMFDEDFIDNDLLLVKKSIKKYYEED